VQDMKNDKDHIRMTFFDDIVTEYEAYKDNKKDLQNIYDPDLSLKKEFFLEEKIE